VNLRCALSCAAALALLSAPFNAVRSQSDADRSDAVNIAEILVGEHYSEKTLDEKMSMRWLDLFLKRIDSSKSYFEQGDIEEFRKREKEYGELFKGGDLKPALGIFKRLQKRVAERLPLIKELLATDLDPKDSALKPTPPFEKAIWPANADDVREHWSRRLRYEMLLLEGEGFSAVDATQLLRDRFEGTAKRVLAVDEDHAVDLALDTLAGAFDSGSHYVSPRMLSRDEERRKRGEYGVGVSVRCQDGGVYVHRILPRGPAERDGKIHAGDAVVGIDSTDSGKMLPVAGLNETEVIDMLRGPEGERLRLEFVPAGKGTRTIVTLMRGLAEALSMHKAIVDLPKPASGDAKQAGYFFVPEMYRTAAIGSGGGVRSAVSQMAYALTDPDKGMMAKKIGAVIIDLRTSQTGVLEPGFQQILTEHRRPFYREADRKVKNRFYSNPEVGHWQGPVVVLVSRLTGGPAELMAAALKYRNRALLIGETTGGTNTIQTVFDIDSKAVVFERMPAPLGLLRVSTKQFFEMDGRPIPGRGIEPHIKIPWLLDPERRIDQGLNPPTAERIHSLSNKFDAAGIDAKTIKSIRKNSTNRQAKSADFQQHLREMEEFRKIVEERDNGITREQLSTLSIYRRKDTLRIRRLEESLGAPRDFYLDEVFAIAAQLVGMTGK
jgi:carboxyl-terminal processing protease